MLHCRICYYKHLIDYTNNFKRAIIRSEVQGPFWLIRTSDISYQSEVHTGSMAGRTYVCTGLLNQIRMHVWYTCVHRWRLLYGFHVRTFSVEASFSCKMAAFCSLSCRSFTWRAVETGASNRSMQPLTNKASFTFSLSENSHSSFPLS